MHRKGYTLAELQAGLILGIILILMIGSISSITATSYQRLREEIDVYEGIFWSLTIVSSRIRAASVLTKEVWANPWLNEVLIFDDQALGVYQDSGERQLVYLADKDNPANRKILFSVQDPYLIMSVTMPGSRYVTINLVGSLRNVPFDLTNTIVRRAP